MTIVLARIDDRLVHGQVVEGWLRIIKASCIIIASDEVAKDTMQQALLSMAVPNDISVASYTIDETAGKLKNGELNEEKILILFSNPKDVLRLLNHGISIKSLNVGGMHYMPGKKQILQTLSVDEKDISALISINDMGVELEGRVLPGDDKVNVSEVIQKYLKNRV
jgi:PTS system mannose-specific IIB component